MGRAVEGSPPGITPIVIDLSGLAKDEKPHASQLSLNRGIFSG
jgi:hypothetical protein